MKTKVKFSKAKYDAHESKTMVFIDGYGCGNITCDLYSNSFSISYWLAGKLLEAASNGRLIPSDDEIKRLQNRKWANTLDGVKSQILMVVNGN